jgi:hypothetical protein
LPVAPPTFAIAILVSEKTHWFARDRDTSAANDNTVPSITGNGLGELANQR